MSWSQEDLSWSKEETHAAQALQGAPEGEGRSPAVAGLLVLAIAIAVAGMGAGIVMRSFAAAGIGIAIAMMLPVAGVAFGLARHLISFHEADMSAATRHIPVKETFVR